MTDSTAKAGSLPIARDLAKIIFNEAGTEYAQELASSITNLVEGDEPDDTYNEGQEQDDSNSSGGGSIQITVELPQAPESGRIRPKTVNDLLVNRHRRPST